jgi:hypothetical protein
LLAASTFANRTALDGSAITTSYSFDNTSNNSILISLSDSQLHSVKHSYETGIRENQARARVTETWRSKNCDNDWSKACKGVTQLPVSSVTFKNSHRFRNQTIYPAGNKYSAYQNVYKDSPAVTDLSGVPAVTPLAGYSCSNSDITQYSYFGGWVTAAYANGINSFSVCRYYDDDDSGPKNTFSELVSSVSQAVEIKSGFPRNNINSSTTDYNLNTEELTVVNSTLGQDILPVGGWYRVPPKTAISIVKKVRMPVLTHFYDNELANLGAFSSYSEKKLDKSTTWKVDTDITITRVIDPGDIQEVNNVTPSISMAGLGIYQKTISR